LAGPEAPIPGSFNRPRPTPARFFRRKRVDLTTPASMLDLHRHVVGPNLISRKPMSRNRDRALIDPVSGTALTDPRSAAAARVWGLTPSRKAVSGRVAETRRQVGPTFRACRSPRVLLGSRGGMAALAAPHPGRAQGRTCSSRSDTTGHHGPVQSLSLPVPCVGSGVAGELMSFDSLLPVRLRPPSLRGHTVSGFVRPYTRRTVGFGFSFLWPLRLSRRDSTRSSTQFSARRSEIVLLAARSLQVVGWAAGQLPGRPCSRGGSSARSLSRWAGTGLNNAIISWATHPVTIRKPTRGLNLRPFRWIAAALAVEPGRVVPNIRSLRPALSAPTAFSQMARLAPPDTGGPDVRRQVRRWCGAGRCWPDPPHRDGTAPLLLRRRHDASGGEPFQPARRPACPAMVASSTSSQAAGEPERAGRRKSPQRNVVSNSFHRQRLRCPLTLVPRLRGGGGRELWTAFAEFSA